MMSLIKAASLRTTFTLFKPLCTYPMTVLHRSHSDKKDGSNKLPKAKTPVGKLDEAQEGERTKTVPQTSSEYRYESFPDDVNPETGEKGGPRGPEPTRYGDWERKGRVIDF